MGRTKKILVNLKKNLKRWRNPDGIVIKVIVRVDCEADRQENDELLDENEILHRKQKKLRKGSK